MQRTIRHAGREWSNPAIVRFTDAARQKVAENRAAFPHLTPVFGWVTSIRVQHKDGTSDDLGDGLILSMDDVPDRAFLVALDGSPVGIQILGDATASDAPVIDTGIKGVHRLQFRLR